MGEGPEEASCLSSGTWAFGFSRKESQMILGKGKTELEFKEKYNSPGNVEERRNGLAEIRW